MTNSWFLRKPVLPCLYSPKSGLFDILWLANTGIVYDRLHLGAIEPGLGME